MEDEVASDEAYCSACNQSYPPETPVCPVDGARLVRLAADRDKLIGLVFDGRYEIRAPLGQGGMGTVYRGWQLSVDREVAIKVIHPKLSNDRAIVKRFLREARLASRLSQPSIVNVYDFGQCEHALYIVMELLRGHTLSSVLHNNRIDIRRTLAIGHQLCDALAAAHAQGIIHRDLKPGNIVILDDPPGRDLIKVLDFGLAKSFVDDAEGSSVTSMNMMIGTPRYMAPEQIEGKVTDQRTDLYALGCILYEMVSGAPPFADPVLSTLLARHIADPPAPLPDDVPPTLRVVIEQLLAKNPEERVQSAEQVRTVLEAVMDVPGMRLSTSNPDMLVGDTEVAAVDVLDSERHQSVALFDPEGRSAPRQRPDLSVKASRDVGREPMAVTFGRASWVAAGLLAVVLSGLAIYVINRPDASVSPAPPVAAVATAPMAVDSRPVDAPPVDRPAVVTGPSSSTTPSREVVASNPIVQPPEPLAPKPARDHAHRIPPTTSAVTPKKHTPPVKAAPQVGVADPTTNPSEPPVTDLPPSPPTPKDPAVVASDRPKPPTTPSPVESKLDHVAIRKAVTAKLGPIQQCFERAKMDDLDLQGTVVVKIQLAADGAVASAQVASSTLGSPSAEHCITGEIAHWHLPSNGAAATFNYPFAFH